MGTGIIVCGLNGVGKSTLGKALAEKLNFHFIDNEDLYFPKTDPNYMYAVSRTQDEVELLLYDEIRAHENFVFSAVTGKYGEAAAEYFNYAVLLSVPKDIRMRRVKDRSFKKFGDRMLPGGDLYDREQGFFELVRSRDENMTEDWLRSFGGTVIRIDGTKPVEENIEFIIGQLQH